MMNRRSFLAGLGASSLAAYQAKKEPPKKQPPKTETLMARILRLTGFSATPRDERGWRVYRTGDIWRMSAGGKNPTQERLTFDGGYRSPVFATDDQKILAIRGNELVWISLKDSSTAVACPAPRELVRLIGFEVDAGEPKVVVVTDGPAGLLSLADATFQPLESDSEDEEYLRGALSDGPLVFQGTLVATRNGGHDLTIRKRNDRDVDLTPDSKAIYTDPVLSHDGAMIVFIRIGT